MNLETLILEFGADFAALDAALNQANKKAESTAEKIEKSFKDLKLLITPRVNHKPLDELNKHLDRKEEHIEDINKKEIKLSVNVSEINDLSEKLESIQDILSDSFSFEIDISGAGNALDSMAQSAQDSLQENFELFKQNTAKFAKFATAPFEAVFTGVFEGIGNSISKKIGKGLESSLKKSTNVSLKGIGGFLGDITSEVLSQIDETVGLRLNVRNIKSGSNKKSRKPSTLNTETEDPIKPKKLSKAEQSNAITKNIQETAQAINKITNNAIQFAESIKNIEIAAKLVASILFDFASDTKLISPDLANIKNIATPEPVPVLAETKQSLKSSNANAGGLSQSSYIPKPADSSAPKLNLAGNYKDFEKNTDAVVKETMAHIKWQSEKYKEVAQVLNKTGDKRERLSNLINKAERGNRELNTKELAESLEIIKELRGKSEFVLNDDITKRAENRIYELGAKLPNENKQFGSEYQRITADIARRKQIAQQAIIATDSFITTPKTNVEKQIFEAWNKTTKSVKENIKEIAEESQKNSKKIQGGISEASPGPTSNARKNWKYTSDYIKEQIKAIVEDAKNAAKQIDGNFAAPDQKRLLRLERVIESKLKQGEVVPDSVLNELKNVFTRPVLVSRENITDDYLIKIQRATILAIRHFGANNAKSIALLDKLNDAREIASKQEFDKINRIPKTWKEINEQSDIRKKIKEQEAKLRQETESQIQKEIADLNKLANSISQSKTPEKLAELEKKRQAIREKYEQKRAKEFQEWLKDQKDIGINRNTDFGRQSRINELRSSINQRKEETNKIIQNEINSLDKIAAPFNNQVITDDYLVKIQRATIIAIRKFGADNVKSIALLDKLNAAREIASKQEFDKINRIPKTWKEINEQSDIRKKIKEQEAKLRQETEAQIQKEIADLNKLANSISQSKTPEKLAELERKRQAIREKYEQKRAKEFQEWLKDQKDIGIIKPSGVFSQPQDENRKVRLKEKIERLQRNNLPVPSYLTNELNRINDGYRTGLNKAKQQTDESRENQNRIKELRERINRRRADIQKGVQKEVETLNRISQPFATKEINQDYLNKLQKAVQIAIRKFGANSNRTIELLNKLESARDVFIQQEANKAQKNQRIKSPQEWKSIKEQEKKRQQEAEKKVQEEIEGLRRLGAPDPKVMANIEARRKIILDRRAAREKEARERAELARLKQERQEETSLQGFLNRPLRALNRVRRSTFADAKIETLAQKYADFGTESYFDKFFRSMSNRIKRKISKDPNERETVAREGFGMLFGMTAMSNPLLPALASLAPLALPLLPTALAVSGAVNMVSPAFQGASQRIQGVENFNARLNAVTGDPVKSGAEYEYLLGLAEKYRVSLQSLSDGYTQLAVATRGTKLEGEPTKELFSAITASIKAMRLNTFDASLVLNAYTQIVAKGKISMEELRQQLGEKFPPTMSVFAKALGVSQAELGQLVAKGSLLSDEVLPKVTKVLEQEFGSAAEKGTSDFTSALASMETALFKLDRNFTDIFGGMFAGITNLASGIVTSFSDNFRIISQLAGAFTIGVVAQVGIGLSTILAMPKIAPFVSNIQGFIMGAWKTGLITLTPFMSGILADVIDDVFNTENDLFTNMAKGTTNIIAASIGSLENISYGASGKGFFGYNWEKAVNPIQSIGNTLGNLFKSIPSGVFELTALTFMFEQLIVLGQMFLVPLLSKLWLTFKGMGGAIWTAATNAKSLGGVFDTLFASSAMAKGALVALNIALKAFVALGFMAFARSDFTNPLQASLNESEQKIGASIDNIQKLLNKLEAPTLEVKVKRGDELPSKGLELNLMAILGDESSSYKTDDVIKEGKGFIPVDNPLIRLHLEQLAKEEVPVKQQEAKRLGLEKYLNDYNGFFTLAQDQLLNNAKDLERVNQEVLKALTKQSLMPETVNKSINLLNPFANEAKIIDASIQRLQKERIAAGLTNTSDSKIRIREIDKEIKKLNDLRKEKIKPLDEFMTDFESLRKGLNSRIEAIDKQDLPEGAKKALKAIVENNQKTIEETRKILDKAGFYDILIPLESAWQKATDELKDFEVEYEKTMRRIENSSFNDQTAIYRSKGLNPVQISEQLTQIEIQKQKNQIEQFEANLIKQQQTLEQYLSVPESGRTQDQVDAIENTRKAVFEAEKELASARLSLAKSEYDLTQDRLKKQQAETKLRVDSEIAKKRIEVIRANPFGGINASFKNAQIDVEEKTKTIALLYQQLADNTGNPIEIKSQIVSAELALEQAKAGLLQQQRSLEDYYRNLDRQIQDFNYQLFDFNRQLEDTRLSAIREVRTLNESYSDLVRELDKNILDLSNQLEDVKDKIKLQQLKNQLIVPGASGLGRELNNIILEYLQSEADSSSKNRSFESRIKEVESNYLASLRRIRDLQEQQQEAEKNRLKTIEDIRRTQENLVRSLSDLIRQTQRELGGSKDSINRVNNEIEAIAPKIQNSGQQLASAIQGVADSIKKTNNIVNFKKSDHQRLINSGSNISVKPTPPKSINIPRKNQELEALRKPPSATDSTPLIRRQQIRRQQINPKPQPPSTSQSAPKPQPPSNPPKTPSKPQPPSNSQTAPKPQPNTGVLFNRNTPFKEIFDQRNWLGRLRDLSAPTWLPSIPNGGLSGGSHIERFKYWRDRKTPLVAAEGANAQNLTPAGRQANTLLRQNRHIQTLLDIAGLISGTLAVPGNFQGNRYGLKPQEFSAFSQHLGLGNTNLAKANLPQNHLAMIANLGDLGLLDELKELEKTITSVGDIGTNEKITRKIRSIIAILFKDLKGKDIGTRDLNSLTQDFEKFLMERFQNSRLRSSVDEGQLYASGISDMGMYELKNELKKDDILKLDPDSKFEKFIPSLGDLPPIPKFDFDVPKDKVETIKELGISLIDAEKILEQLNEEMDKLTALDQLIEKGRQITEAWLSTKRAVRDAIESVADLTLNAKGYLTVQEQIKQVGIDVARQYRSQLESLQDQRKALEFQIDSNRRNLEETTLAMNALKIKKPEDTETANEYQKQIDALTQSTDDYVNQLSNLDGIISQVENNRGIAVRAAEDQEALNQAYEALDKYNSLMADLADRREMTSPLAAIFGGGGAKLRIESDYRKRAKELSEDIRAGLGTVYTPEQAREMQSALQEMADTDLTKAFVDANPVASGLRDIIKGAVTDFENLGQTALNVLESIANKLLDNGLNMLLGNLFGGGGGISNLFGGVGNIGNAGGGLGSLFSGGFDSLFSGGLGSLFGSGGGFLGASASNFSLGTLPAFVPGFAYGGSLNEAMQKERNLSGKEPVLSVLHQGEEVLSTLNQDAQFYRALKRSGQWDELKTGSGVQSFATGGTVRSVQVDNGGSSNQRMAYAQTTVYNITTPNADSFRKSQSQLIEERERRNREQIEKYR